MRAFLLGTFLILVQGLALADNPARLVIHGGAGTIERSKITPELERQYTEALSRALRAGHAVLAGGGAPVDAVVAAITIMEDSPLFNAGKGAVFTHEGRNELDASIMDGRARAAGAVASVTTIRNPILAARAVMQRSPHVMLIGAGAEAFAKEAGLELVDPAYFRTEQRWQQLQEAIAGQQVLLDHGGPAQPKDEKRGTVGAVALDAHGNLAAGTSTGGMTNKRWGRVGDSPIIGAGTWADNRSVAVSATGTGEMFIRSAAAHQIASRVMYAGESPADAATHTLEEIAAISGDGGLIVLDAKGNYAMKFNTEGMYRGTIGADGVPWVGIYGEPEKPVAP